MKRRTVLALGAGVTAAAALGGVGYVAATNASPYMPERALPVGKIHSEPIELQFGQYHLQIGEKLFSLQKGSDVIWATENAFLYAGLGRQTWTERVGHFSADTVVSASLVEQRITSASASPTQANITGTLRDRTHSFPFTLVLTADSYGLSVDLLVPGADFVGMRFSVGVYEQVHGAGEQFASWDLRGLAFHLVTREQGVGRGRQPLTLLAEATNGAGGSPTTTYAPIPYLMTSGFRSLSWVNDEVAEVDLRNALMMDVRVWSPSFNAYLENAGDYPTLIRSHTRRTGRMQPLPKWTGGGAIFGLQGGTDAVREKLEQLQSEKPAIAGVWMQDWVGRRVTDFGSRLWWTWELDRSHYPNFSDLQDELTAQGIRTLSYVNPFVVDPAEKPNPVSRNLYEEAIGNDFLVKNADGAPYALDQGGFDAFLVDLSNPAARNWFGDVIYDQVALAGNGGWMADFSESLPFDSVISDGTPATWHNRWPAVWAELNAQVRERLGGDQLVFHRAAWRGSPASTGCFWAGDQMVDWDGHDGMANALYGILAGGVSGMTLNHTDIGGYTGLNQPIVGVRRTPELLRRWAEWAAWTPVFRTHEGNRPDEQTQAYDSDVRRAVAVQSRVFAALSDYRDEVMEQAAIDGVPAMRHAALHFPGTLAATVADQYFYGDRFLVAPMFSPEAFNRGIAFPPGNWTHVWTNKTFEGDARGSVRAGLSQTPVFYRTGDKIAAEIARQVRRAAL